MAHRIVILQHHVPLGKFPIVGVPRFQVDSIHFSGCRCAKMPKQEIWLTSSFLFSHRLKKLKIGALKIQK